MLSALIVGANADSIHAINSAKKLGLTVAAIDGDSESEGFIYACENYTVDISNKELVLDISNKIQPKLVIPTPIGRFLTSVGAINDQHKLNGISEKSAILCTDKHVFHKVLSAQNNRNAKHILVNAGIGNFNDINANLTYPAIIKPRYGSGSRDVFTVFNSDQMKLCFAEKFPCDEDYIIESCKEGDEYGVDGAVINGVFQLISLRKKMLTPFPFRQCVGYFSTPECEENFTLFMLTRACINKVCNILNINNSLLHADVIYDGGPDIFVIEISARPAGHFLYDVFVPLSTGIDMVSEFIKFSLPELNQSYTFDPSHKKSKCMLIKFFDFSKGRITVVPDENYLYNHYPVKKYVCSLKPGMTMDKITDGKSIIGRGYYIIEADNNNELLGISKEIEGHFILED